MIDSLLNLLPEHWRGVALSFIATIGVLRLFIKPVGEWLKGIITRAAEKASTSLDPDDDTVIEDILETRGYRVIAFLLDLFASVKLPARRDLFQPNPNDPIRSI